MLWGHVCALETWYMLYGHKRCLLVGEEYVFLLEKNICLLVGEEYVFLLEKNIWVCCLKLFKVPSGLPQAPFINRFPLS